jgi:hypothetical protein
MTHNIPNDQMNGSWPAYPHQALGTDGLPQSEPCPGLTKRELFAAMAMQGLLANPRLPDMQANTGERATERVISEQCVEFADALLTALKESQP